MVRIGFRKRPHRTAMGDTRRTGLRQTTWNTERARGLCGEALEERLTLSVVPGANANLVYDQVSPDWFAQVNAANVSRSVVSESVYRPSGQSLTNNVDDASDQFEWIVRLTPDAVNDLRDVASADAIWNAHSGAELTVVRGLGLPGLVLVRGSTSDEPQHVTDWLRSHASVAYVTPNFPVHGQADPPNDPLFPQQSNLDQINMEMAWDETTGSSEVVVGIIDTGIDTAHPDLYENIWLNQGEIPSHFLLDDRPLSIEEFAVDPTAAVGRLVDVNGDGRITFSDLNYRDETGRWIHQQNGVLSDQNDNGFIDAQDLRVDPRWADGLDTDGNRFRDDLVGWDFHNNDNDPTDDHFHGTHVAGIVGAAGNNRIGVTGVTWRSSLMALKFLDHENRGATADAVMAINYATMMKRDHGVQVRVTNNSWGEQGEFNPALRDAIAASHRADILFVAAAGNGDSFGDGIDNDRDPFLPASYDLENIISVAALDPQGNLARFSNYGADSVDIAAPGVGILSSRLSIQSDLDSLVESRNGTSMATPHVTGVAALVWAQQPDASVEEVREAILQSAPSSPSLEGQVDSARRLDAGRALRAETFGPTVRLEGRPRITAVDVGALSLTINFEDSEGVNVATLDDADLLIQRAGFSAQTLVARPKLESLARAGDSTSFSVEYEISPPEHPFDIPNGTWHPIDNGVYDVTLKFGQIRDEDGFAASGRHLGSFTVEIPDDATKSVSPTDDESLRSLIQEANRSPGLTTIVLQDGVYALNRAGANEDEGATGDLDILDDLTILGGGSDQVLLDARSLDRVFDILPNVNFKLSGVTLVSGSASTGGALRNQGITRIQNSMIRDSVAQAAGGGIWNRGELEIVDSTVDANHTTNPLGGGGGGIYNIGQMSIQRSTLSANTSSGGFIGQGGGGALFNDSDARSTSTLEIVNSTFSGNVASGGDGGAILVADGELSIIHATVVANQAPQGIGGGIFVAETCVDQSACPEILNSIVATNEAVADADVAGRFVSRGGNFIGRVGNSSGFVRDQIGFDGDPLDPRLGPLADNGGPTLTHAPLPNSPVVASVLTATETTTDQRGVPRLPDVRLVADINQVRSVQETLPTDIPILWQGEYYFAANRSGLGTELWKSGIDSDADEAQLVSDINPGAADSRPRSFVAMDDRLYFVATSQDSGSELWSTDGTAAGTVLVKDIAAGAEDSNPANLTNVEGQLFFSAIDDFGRELWRSDGTRAGTHRISDIQVGSVGSHPADLTALGNRLFFTASDKSFHRELWISDGTTSGTHVVRELGTGVGSYPQELTSVGDVLFFSAAVEGQGRELWQSDGTSDGTRLVVDLSPGRSSSSPKNLVVSQGKLYFTIAAPQGGNHELWVWDEGEAKSTDVTVTSRTRDWKSLDDDLFFVDGDELKRINTNQLLELTLLSDATELTRLTVQNGALFFRLDDAVMSYSPQSNAIRPVVNVPQSNSTLPSDPYDLFIWNDELHVFANAGPGRGLFNLHDQRLVDSLDVGFDPYSAPTSPRLGILRGDTLMMGYEPTTAQLQLWKTDGTQPGSQLLGEFASWVVGPFEVTLHDGQYYFLIANVISNNVISNEVQLWTTNGTQDGTYSLKTFSGNFLGFAQIRLAEAADELFMIAGTGFDGLWKTNGTVEGTVLVAELSRQGGEFSRRELVVNRDQLFFVVNDEVTGRELWTSDGSAAATGLLTDIRPGSPSSDPQNLTVFNREVFFTATDGRRGRELWRTDGTSDGTSFVADISPGNSDSNPRGLVVLGDELFFTATDGRHGHELWKTNGTEAGTVQVADIRPGSESSYPNNLVVSDGRLFFSADDGHTGRELWVSEGTSETTRRVADLALGEAPSLPAPLLEVDRELYFAADDGEIGRELWKVTPVQSAGAANPELGTVRGTVFDDRDGDGNRDSNELGLSGWTVFADLNANGILDEVEPRTTTRGDNLQDSPDVMGTYELESLPQGVFHVTILNPNEEYANTFPTQVDSTGARVDEVVSTTSPGVVFDGLGREPIVVGGRVVFQSDSAEIYASSDVSTPIVATGDLLPSGEVIAQVHPKISLGGNFVAFSATRGEIFTAYVQDQFGEIATIADSSTPVRGGGALGGHHLIAESILGEVVAISTRPSNDSSILTGLYVVSVDSAAELIADQSTLVPGQTEEVTFSSFDAIQLDQDSFAFSGRFTDQTGSETTGIFVGDRLRPFEPVYTRAHAGRLPFSYSEGEVAFVESVVHKRIQLVSRQRDPVVIASTDDLIPYGRGRFTEFSGVSIDRGRVVFVGHGAEDQQGIYSTMGTANGACELFSPCQKVVDLTDDIFGDRTAKHFSLGPDALNGNQLVFHVEFDDDSHAIYAATYTLGSFHLVGLDHAEVINDVDFGRRALPGTVRGHVYHDLNANDVRDTDEIDDGLGGWVVFIDENGNGQRDAGEPETVTDSQGGYDFAGLPALRSYSIVVNPLSDAWISTSGEAEPIVSKIELDAGAIRDTVDFGFRNRDDVTGAGQSGRIVGVVYEDLNSNGKSDPGEPGVVGLRVFLDLNDDGRWTSNEPSEMTGDRGEYSFENRDPGTHRVRLAETDEWHQMTPKGNRFERFPIREIADSTAAIAFVPDIRPGRESLVVARNGTDNVSVIRDPAEALSVTDEQVGDAPVAIAVADLNQDGRPDYAVANEGSYDVSIVLQTGLGSAIEVSRVGVGTQPFALAAADFDNDGDVDLAVANSGSSDLTLLRNRGDGQFDALRRIPVSGQPSGLSFIELNDDRRIDLAVTLRDRNEVALLRNDGGGRFTIHSAIPVAAGPVAITKVQLNDDNDDQIVNDQDRPDLAVAALSNGRVSILTATDAPFSFTTSRYQVGGQPASLLGTDIDSDGDQDIVVSIQDAVSILRNRGNGVFQTPELAGSAVFRFPVNALGIAAGDLDRDGDSDLALANGIANGVTLLINEIVSGTHRLRVQADAAVRADFGVEFVNHPPTLDPISDQILQEDESNPARLTVSLTGISAGPGEDEPLEILVATDRPDLLGVTVSEIDRGDGSAKLNLRPRPNEHGIATVQLEIRDPGRDGILSTADDGRTVETFRVVVDSLNDLPIAVDDVYSVPAGATDWTLDVLVNDDDANPDRGEGLIVFVSATPREANIHSSADGRSLVLTLDPDASGTLIFTYYVSDGVFIDQGTVSLNIESSSGDFDDDGVLTLADLEFLARAIQLQLPNEAFDLNNDGQLDAEDYRNWVKEIRGTSIGDANLDGIFDSRDFVLVFTAGEYEDQLVRNSTWSEGDWNGDGEFDSSDFVAAFLDGEYRLPLPATTTRRPFVAADRLVDLRAAAAQVRSALNDGEYSWAAEESPDRRHAQRALFDVPMINAAFLDLEVCETQSVHASVSDLAWEFRSRKVDRSRHSSLLVDDLFADEASFLERPLTPEIEADARLKDRQR